MVPVVEAKARNGFLFTWPMASIDRGHSLIHASASGKMLLTIRSGERERVGGKPAVLTEDTLAGLSHRVCRVGSHYTQLVRRAWPMRTRK